jgi:8-oxo-dGTP diphosphatase
MNRSCKRYNLHISTFFFEVNALIAQAVIVNDTNEVLMVRQYVERGDIVWNYPGGCVEVSETPEQACIREVKEETGFDIRILDCLCFENLKYTYIAEIVGGTMSVDRTIEQNEDILEVKWVRLDDDASFDVVTRPIRRRLCG